MAEGLYHLGVVKALLEEKLIPKVISGSSVGSLVAALVGTHTDEVQARLTANWQNALTDSRN
jgi:predicted acylesterase/phospholipase RssA